MRCPTFGDRGRVEGQEQDITFLDRLPVPYPQLDPMDVLGRIGDLDLQRRRERLIGDGNARGLQHTSSSIRRSCLGIIDLRAR